MGEQIDPPLRLNGRYRLVAWLAEETTGTLYRAHDDVLERDVAVMFLKPELVTDANAGERFMREARAAARLTHPNIVSLHDFGEQSGWHYLVLESVVGQSLRDVLDAREGPLPHSDAVDGIRGVLAALAYAHDEGIVHGDIRPENVIRAETGQVKVTGFGTPWVSGRSIQAGKDHPVGAAAYLAPEVVRGGQPDAHSDLYAVGMMACELLTGQLPDAGGTERRR